VTTTCCNSIVRTIEIATPRGGLAMAYCERCEKRRWFHNEVQVHLRDVLSMTANDWRDTKLWHATERHLTVAS